jgi:hypothetical protein
MNKKIIAGIAAAGVAGAAAIILPISALAATTGDSTFTSKLAQKLGIDQAKIESALSEVKTEMQAERIAEIQAEIKTLVESGKLTQRQADILNAEMKYREEIKPSDTDKPTKEEMDSLTEDERKAKMDAFKTEMQSKLLAKLNENGLNTSLDEIEKAHEAAKDAGLKVGPHGRGDGGAKGWRI